MQNAQQVQIRIDEAPQVKAKCAAVYKLNNGSSAYARAYSVLPRPQVKPPPVKYPLVAGVALSSYNNNIDECASRRTLQARSCISYKESLDVEHAYAGKEIKDCGEEIPNNYYW